MRERRERVKKRRDETRESKEEKRRDEKERERERERERKRAAKDPSEKKEIWNLVAEETWLLRDLEQVRVWEDFFWKRKTGGDM